MKYLLLAQLSIGPATDWTVINPPGPPKCPDGYTLVLIVKRGFLEAFCAKEIVEPLK